MTSVPYISSSRRRLRLIGLILALFAIVLLARFAWPAKVQANPASKADAAVPVQMLQAQVRNLPIWVDAIGSVQALNTVNVRVRVDGELQKVMFNEGQMVTAGSPLAQIDPRVYQAQVAQAQALVAKDQAQLANLRVNLTRATNLAAAKAGPTQDVDTYRAQLAAQQATVQADQAALDNARLQLQFTTVTAPLTGRTGQRLLDVGSIAHGAEATGLVTITQMNPISVAFSVSQDELPRILQENAKQNLQVVAMTRDGKQQIASGHLSFIDSQVSAASGQIQLKAEFNNDNSQLWPGQLVSARVLVKTQQDATVVPATAVQDGAKGPYVYVVDAEHKAQVRQVDAGTVVDGQQWIRDGLRAGETVVVQGQSRIAPGLSVSEVKTEAKSEAQTADASHTANLEAQR